MWSRFEGLIHVHSGKAVLFQSWYWDAAMWLPKSQIKIHEDGDITFVVDVRDWLVDKRNILEFTHYSEEHINAET